MKHILLSLLVVLTLGISAHRTLAFSAGNTQELIIMVPDAEPGRNTPEIQDALNNLAGVTVVGFCNSQKCFYLHVDRHDQPTDRNIIDAVTALGHQVEVKQNGTIDEAQANCKDR